MENTYSLELITDQTSIPNLLLDHYRDLGLSENEVFFLIILLRLKQKKDVLTPRIIARETSYTENDMFILIMPLVEKGFLTYNGTVIQFADLIDRLLEVRQWLEVKAEQNLKKEKKSPKPDNNYAGLYRCFETEMGRPLSPMEGEQITYWYNTLGFSAELIKEALRRSVLRGVFSFRYIESILFSWQKQNIRSMQDLRQYDKNREQQLICGKRKIDNNSGKRSYRGEQEDFRAEDFFEV